MPMRHGHGGPIGREWRTLTWLAKIADPGARRNEARPRVFPIVLFNDRATGQTFIGGNDDGGVIIDDDKVVIVTV